MAQTQELKTELIIEAIERGFDNVVESFNKIGEGGEKAKKGTEVFGLSLTDLKSGIDLALGAGRQFTKWMGDVVDLAKEGVAFERSAFALEGYAGSADMAEESVRLMIETLDGGISKIEATSNATRLFSMGLATNAEEAARVAEVAVTLGNAVGNTGDSFSDFTLMLANQSIMRLDNFGLSSGRVRERINELMESTEGLDRQTAFLTATLEEADRKMIQLDQAGFENVSTYDKLEAAADDAMLTLKLLIKDALEPAAQAAVDLITWSDRLAGAYENLSDRTLDTTSSYEEYLVVMLQHKREAVGLSGQQLQMLKILEQEGATMADVADKWENYQSILEILTDQTGALSEEQYRLAMITAIYSDEGEKMAQQYTYNAEASDEYTTALEALEEAERLAAEAAQQLRQDLDEYHMLLKGEWSKTQEDYNSKLTDLETQLADTRAELELVAGEDYYDEQVEDVAELVAKEGELEAAIVAVKEEHDRATKSMILNMMEQKLAIDGLTDKELDFLVNLAHEWGLIDDEMKTVWDSIDTVDTLLNDTGTTGEEAAQLISDVYRGDVVDAMETVKDYTQDLIDKTSDLADEISSLPDHTVTIDIKVNDPHNAFTGGAGGGGGGTVNEMMATGGQFIVPPGFERDNYLVGFSSGEVVNVGQGSGASAQVSVIFGDINVSGGADIGAVQSAVRSGARSGVLSALRERGLA